MKSQSIPMKAVLIFAALALLVPVLVAAKAVFFSGCSKPEGSQDDMSFYAEEIVDTWKLLPGEWQENGSRASESLQPSAGGGDLAAVPAEGFSPGPAGGQGFIDPPLYASLGGGDLTWGDYAYTYKGYGGWKSWDYWSYYNWLSRYYRYVWKKYHAGAKKKWLVPGSPGSYYVTMPGGFGLYDDSSGSWTWKSDTDEDEAAAGEPVTTPSSVSVVFASPREASATGSPLVLKSFDRASGNELFSVRLPPGTRDFRVSEDTGVVTVETCYGDPAPCDRHAFNI